MGRDRLRGVDGPGRGAGLKKVKYHHRDTVSTHNLLLGCVSVPPWRNFVLGLGIPLKIKKIFLGLFLKVLFSILMAWFSARHGLRPGSGFLTRVPWTSLETIVFLASFAAYFLIHFLLYQPVLSHVMAHELTHALAAMLMGEKSLPSRPPDPAGRPWLTSPTSSSAFGPLYLSTLHGDYIGTIYAIAAQPSKIYLLGLIGFTYAFHLALTVWSLSNHQPDLKEGGVVFSLIFIFAGNMIVLMLLFSLVWPQVLPVPLAFSETLRWAWHLAQSAFQFLKLHLFRPEGTPT